MQQSPDSYSTSWMLNGGWSFAVWFPCTATSCAAAAYLFFAADDGLPMPRGPGGGGEGILFLFVWFLRLLALLALVACFVLRPRGETWNGRSVVISTLLWVSIFTGAAVAYRQVSGVTVNVRAVDTAGRTLSGVRMDYRWSKSLPLKPFTENRGTAVTDVSGTATFRVPTFHNLYVYGAKEVRPTHEVSISDQGGTTLLVCHSKNGVSDRNTFRATPPKASQLKLSMEFDPPTGP